MNSSKVPRPKEEMIVALKKQVRLLNDYARKVFIEKNNDYIGEIANKLRLLVTKFKSNEPLLLRLMDETGIHPKIILGGPPIPITPSGLRGGDQITLEEYLDLEAIGIKVPSGDFIILNKIDFIRALAEQAGGSHEDWKMDEALATILSTPIYIMGLHNSIAELKTSLDTVLDVAEQLLTILDKQSKE